MDVAPKPTLERKLGAKTLAINSMNLTIGAGIFILPAYIAGYLGTMSFLAYLFCALFIGLLMLCFAELGSTADTSGGAYGYIERAFGSLAGFVANTLFWLGYSVLADAAILNAMVDMLGLWFPIFTLYWFKVLFLFLVIGMVAYVNILGVKSGATMVVVLTALKLAPLVLLIIIGLFSVESSNLTLSEIPDVTTFGAACLMLFFAFGGTETALNISGEMKDPGKTIPKGIFLGILGILVIYLLLQFVATGVMGADLAKYTEAPLAETAIRLIGPIGGTILIGTAIVAMYGAVSGDILATSRLPFVAARDGLLPKLLANIHPKYKTPHLSIIVFSSAIFLMSISGGFKTLAILASSATLVIYLGVVLAMFKFRLKRDPDNRPEFVAPGGWIVPIASMCVLIWLMSYIPWREVLALAIFCALCILFYLGFVWWKRKQKATISP